jgi:hypothetical protein
MSIKNIETVYLRVKDFYITYCRNEYIWFGRYGLNIFLSFLTDKYKHNMAVKKRINYIEFTCLSGKRDVYGLLSLDVRWLLDLYEKSESTFNLNKELIACVKNHLSREIIK